MPEEAEVDTDDLRERIHEEAAKTEAWQAAGREVPADAVALFQVSIALGAALLLTAVL